MAAELQVCGHRVTFERRRYPGCTYTWAYLHVTPQATLLMGGSWPAINWPKAELEKEVRRELAQWQAIRILEGACAAVHPDDTDVCNTLRNALEYVRTGYHKISGHRGIASMMIAEAVPDGR